STSLSPSTASSSRTRPGRRGRLWWPHAVAGDGCPLRSRLPRSGGCLRPRRGRPSARSAGNHAAPREQAAAHVPCWFPPPPRWRLERLCSAIVQPDVLVVILMMDEGKVIEEAPPDTFFSSPSHERTKRFLALVE